MAIQGPERGRALTHAPLVWSLVQAVRPGGSFPQRVFPQTPPGEWGILPIRSSPPVRRRWVEPAQSALTAVRRAARAEVEQTILRVGARVVDEAVFTPGAVMPQGLFLTLTPNQLVTRTIRLSNGGTGALPFGVAEWAPSKWLFSPSGAGRAGSVDVPATLQSRIGEATARIEAALEGCKHTPRASGPGPWLCRPPPRRSWRRSRPTPTRMPTRCPSSAEPSAWPSRRRANSGHNLLGQGVRYDTGSEEAFERRLTVGASLRAGPLLLAADLGDPTGSRRFHHAAVEARLGVLTLRGGASGQLAREAGSPDLSAGAGVSLGEFQMDYAYLMPAALPATHRVSLTLRF